MNRRRFVQAGAMSLLVPVMAIAQRTGTRAEEIPSDRFFFDERFPEGRRLASELAGLTTPIPVQGDPTPVWSGGLARASLAAPLALAGATTESFYFCLTVLLRDQGAVHARSVRHDRDLYLWTIRTGHHSRNRT